MCMPCLPSSHLQVLELLCDALVLIGQLAVLLAGLAVRGSVLVLQGRQHIMLAGQLALLLVDGGGVLYSSHASTAQWQHKGCGVCHTGCHQCTATMWAHRTIEPLHAACCIVLLMSGCQWLPNSHITFLSFLVHPLVSPGHYVTSGPMHELFVVPNTTHLGTDDITVPNTTQP